MSELLGNLLSVVIHLVTELVNLLVAATTSRNRRLWLPVWVGFVSAPVVFFLLDPGLLRVLLLGFLPLTGIGLGVLWQRHHAAKAS